MSDKPVYRLLDIEVEEVSLVDRAANQRKFLIVKRSDMSESQQEPEGESDDSEVDETDEPVEHDDTDDGDAEGDEDDDGGEPPEEGGAPPAIVSGAVDALSKLTDAVESLETAGAKGPELAKAKRELRAVAEQLAKAAGGKKPKRKPPSAPPPDEGGDGEDDDDEAQTKSALADVRAALGRVQQLLSRGGAAGKPRKPAKKADSDSKLDAVLERLGAIDAGLKDQKQRLSRLEKQSGLPNSAPVGEPPPGEGEDDSLWSFDLNKPTDRGSVDPSVSFFEQR